MIVTAAPCACSSCATSWPLVPVPSTKALRPRQRSAFGVRKSAGMHDRAGEFGQAGQVRRRGNTAHAGGEDEMARMHNALGAVGATQRNVPSPIRIVIAATGKFGAGPEIEL